MDPLATVPSTLAAPVQTIPAAWIASGAITPVVVSPAATTATAWVPQPAVVQPQQSGSGSLLDAIASAMIGTAPSVTSAGDQGAAQLTTTALPVALPAVAAPATVAAPVVAVAPPALAPAQAQQVVVAPPAAGAATEAPADPTLVSSVGHAIAGFASATGRAIQDVAGAGVSHARKVGTELWAGVRNPRTIHISQVPSKYNPSPAAGNRDCGPASVAMTLRLLGKSIPGVAANAAPQKLINRVRQLAGNAANGASTTNHELERALTAAGTKVQEIADAASVRQAVLAGKPVILNGNPRNPGAYGPKFSAAQMTPYNGAHWIVVSGFDEKAGKFIINDPLSKVGPVKVSPAQLEAYRAGSMGIEVEG